MSLRIRTATVDDLPVLQKFEQELISVERGFDETLKVGPIIYYDIRALLEDGDVLVLLAEIREMPVGCGFARLTPNHSNFNIEYYAHIGLMFVLKEHRGYGIGKAIIERFKQWARQRGALELRLEVYYKNMVAIQTYLRSNFSPFVLAMRAAL